MAGPRQPLHTRYQGIFMGAMERIAGLERDDALPAALGKQGPRLTRREHELAIFGMLGLRQHAHFAPQEHIAGIVHGHVPARMIGALGAVDALDVLGLVPGEDILDRERADDFIFAIGQRDGLAGLQC